MISTTGQSMVMSSSSKFAGRVGMLDILNGLGLRLLALGFNTPFLVSIGVIGRSTSIRDCETGSPCPGGQSQKFYIFW